MRVEIDGVQYVPEGCPSPSLDTFERLRFATEMYEVSHREVLKQSERIDEAMGAAESLGVPYGSGSVAEWVREAHRLGQDEVRAAFRRALDAPIPAAPRGFRNIIAPGFDITIGDDGWADLVGDDGEPFARFSVGDLMDDESIEQRAHAVADAVIGDR